MDTKVPPALWTLGGLLLQRIFPSRRPPRWVRALSLLLFIACVALGIWGLRGFQQHETTVDPYQRRMASKLVTDGALSISRNPMYTALIGGLVSIALWRGRLAALLPAIGVWAALSKFQVPSEEAALAETFGKEFDMYRHRVPRWL